MRNKSDNVDLDAINKRYVEQYKLALDELEEAAAQGQIFRFMTASANYMIIRDPAEHSIRYLEGVDELNKHQRRLGTIFNKTINDSTRWSF